ncbi:MAG TPA: 16S rRNA (cytosine(1402)-N(4))-methyltransferase RsmH [Candidatus Dojkabacteria bacterium]|jgi:16S rRNA (cytosine1402-N4)-methyltransferase
MTKHIPILKKEFIEKLSNKGGIFVDATLGGGGHSKAMLDLFLSKAYQYKLIGIDQNKDAVDEFEGFLKTKGFKKDNQLIYKNKNVVVALYYENFSKLKSILGNEKVDVILADIGISTDQLDDSSKGFSYKTQGKIDLRMDDRLKVTGSDLLNALYKKELADILYKYSDISESKKIAEEIIEYRKKKRIETMKDLNTILEKFDRKGRNLRARVLQALRIIVNNELEVLEILLEEGYKLLKPSGMFFVITFHSGEDRIVKRFFRDKAREDGDKTEIIYPSEEEKDNNPKSSSAKMRILTKS